jgi:hypothetical protein
VPSHFNWSLIATDMSGTWTIILMEDKGKEGRGIRNF